MADAAVRFIRVHGKVIPIRAAASAGAKRAVNGAVSAAKGANATFRGAKLAKGAVQHKQNKSQPSVKVNKNLDAAGLLASIASGVVGAATFSMGAKGFLAGALASHGLDAAGIGLNVASVAGKGNVKGRAQQGARQEARNIVVGNAVFGAGLLASSRNRAAVVNYTKKGLGYASKLVALGRKVLRVA